MAGIVRHIAWLRWPSALLRKLDWRLMLSITMFSVGSLGAYAAYQVGIHELQAQQLERELAQDHVLALTERQRLLDLREANAEFQRRADAFEARGRAYLAAEQKSDQALKVDVLALQAQEEFAARRALLPFVAATRLSFDGAQDDRAVQRGVVRSLGRQGRDVDASGEFKDMWSKLDNQFERDHATVRQLASLVVAFVASLVMFTLADLAKQPRSKQRRFVTGLAIAFGAAGAMLVMSPRVTTTLVLLSGSLMICAGLAWHVGRPRAVADSGHRFEPSGLEPRSSFPGEQLNGRHVPDRWARRLVVFIAGTVFLSALSAYLYNWATTASSAAAHQALRFEIEMHLRNTNRQADALGTLRDLAQVQEERARFSAAAQRAKYLSMRNDPAAASRAAAEAAAFQQNPIDRRQQQNDDADRRQRILRLLDDPVSGMQANPRFLHGIVRQIDVDRRSENYRQSLALWDIFNQRSLAFSQTAGAFLATLTMFAVALYFFGQALSMNRGGAARWLAWSGLGLVFVALLYGGLAFVSAARPGKHVELPAGCLPPKDVHPAPTPAEVRAACEYADAHALLTDARSDDGYKRAVDALSNVVKLIPDSRLAKLDFVHAIERQAMFAAEESYLRLPAPEAVGPMKTAMHNALSELDKLNKRSRGLHQEPARLLSTLGRYTLLLGIVEGKPEKIDAGVSYLRRASDRADDRHLTDADRTRIALNLAIAATLQGHDEEADRHLRAALATTPSNARSIARAITDLEIVSTYCADVMPRRRCESIAYRVAEMKEKLVAAAWFPRSTGYGATAYTDETQASAKQVAISVSASKVAWQGALGSLASDDRVAVVWYRYDDDWKVWRALYEVSGAVEARNSRASDDIAPSESNAGPEHRTTRSYLEASRHALCLGGENERYRAEFYVNGRRVAGTAETTARHGAFRAERLHDLNIALCVPSAWMPEAPSVTMPLDGRLVRGWRTGYDKPPVLRVFAFNAPRVAEQSRGPSAESALQLARAYQITHGWTDTNVESFVRYDRKEPQRCEALLRDAKAVYVSWNDADGMRYMGIALPGLTPPTEICQVLDSMTTLHAVSPVAENRPSGKAESALGARAARQNGSGRREH